MSIGKRLATITAQNTGTEPFNVNAQSVNISITGTFTATITLQRRFRDAGVWLDWLDVKDYTEPAQEIADEIESETQYRLFCKTGNYTSGTINLRLSR